MRPFRFLAPIAAAAAAAVILTGLAGCGGGGGPSFKPIELVPQDANFVADVQIARIINDKDFQDAYNKAPKSGDQPATWDQALAKFTAETGIDLHQFTDGLVFGDLSRASDYFCAVVEGTFDETQFIENIKAKSGTDFTTTDYKGYTLYTQEDDSASITFLGKTNLLAGTTQAVKDSIDVSKGDRNRLKGQLLDTYNGLGAGLIKAAAQIPESDRQALLNYSDQNDTGLSLKPFADTDAIGLSLEKSGSTETLRIEAHFVSSASARDAKDTITGLISLLKGMGTDQSLKDLLGKIEVAVTDSTLKITFSASMADIEKALPGLTNPLGNVP